VPRPDSLNLLYTNLERRVGRSMFKEGLDRKIGPSTGSRRQYSQCIIEGSSMKLNASMHHRCRGRETILLRSSAGSRFVAPTCKIASRTEGLGDLHRPRPMVNSRMIKERAGVAQRVEESNSPRAMLVRISGFVVIRHEDRLRIYRTSGSSGRRENPVRCK